MLKSKIVKVRWKTVREASPDGKMPAIVIPESYEEEVILSDEEEAAVRAQWAIADAMQEQTNYIEKRQNEYPPIEKQLEILCEQGLDALKSVINAVKAKYPKPIAKQ